MDSIVHIENDRLVGRTNFKSGLLNSVVALSIKEVQGVAKISRRQRFSLRGFRFLSFKKRLRMRNGIAITAVDNGLTIDVCIYTDYGFAVPDVCYRVQENIINALSSMTDRKVKFVNIKIANVATPYAGVKA